MALALQVKIGTAQAPIGVVSLDRTVSGSSAFKMQEAERSARIDLVTGPVVTCTSAFK